MRLFIKGIVRSAVILACLFTIDIAHALHVDTAFVGDKAYFLFSAPNKIAVYSMATQSQGADITLTKTPTAFALDDNSAFVAFNREIRVVNLENANSQFVRNVSSDVVQLTLLGNYLYATDSNGVIYIINKSTNALVDTRQSDYQVGSIQIASAVNSAIYTRKPEYYGGMIKLSAAADGTLSNSVTASSSNNYSQIQHLTMNASQTKIYDNSGAAYFAIDLSPTSSLGEHWDDLTFVDNNPLVLRNTSLSILNAQHQELGTINLSSKPNRIAAWGKRVFTFGIENSSINISSVDISGYELSALNAVANPVGLNYTPEFIAHDGQDTVYLVDNDTLSLFRWSVAQQKYLATWALKAPAAKAAYSNAHNRLYLGYANGDIKYFDLTTDTPAETHLTTMTGKVLGLVAADKYLFVSATSDYWGWSEYILSATGDLLSTLDGAQAANSYHWVSALGRIYADNHYNIYWRGLDLATGSIVTSDSIYSYYNYQNTKIVDSRGEVLLTQQGHLIDANDGRQVDALSNIITAGVWVGDRLITVDNNNTLQFWHDNFALDASFPLVDGVNTQLFSINNHLVVIKQSNAGPIINTYDLANLPDTDGDGMHDLKDNCIAIANANQDDYDSDGIGDACDSDDDNDGLTDVTELEFGLNPKDAGDADGDLDGDGFSNRVELLLNSDLKSAASVPAAISVYQEGFENGWPAVFYHTDGKLPWSIQQSGNGHVLQSTALRDTNQSSEVSFTNRFKSGLLSFKYRSNSSGNYNQRLEILIDGALKYSYYASEDAWNQATLELDEGVHTITFRIMANNIPSYETPLHVSIDNLIFDKDTDGDGLPNSIDNCPNQYNPWQQDTDADGIGDECDNDPHGQDADGDGWGDDRDNCPLIANPDQADIDYDGLGDACDDDIDGDGIKGVDEAKYSFMSDFNPNDINLDQDGDGIPNGMEINSGYNPGVADNHPQINMFDYYLVGDLSYTYVDYYGYSYITQFRKSATANQFEMIQDGLISILERRSDGIYLISSKNSWFTYEYTNYLIIPKSLKLGQTIRNSVNFKMVPTDGSAQPESASFEQTLRLVETGKRDWKGRTYDSVTLELSLKPLGEEPYNYEITYLKNLGSLGDEYAWLESATLTNVDKTGSTADGNAGSGGGNSGSGGGSGSSNVWLLLMLFTLASYAQRRHTR